MGNIEYCNKCQYAEKAVCAVCGYQYCRIHDLNTGHDQGVAFFGINTYDAFLRTFNNSPPSVKVGERLMCPAPGCNNIADKKCNDLLCCSYFCQTHRLHLHFKCHYLGCQKTAKTTYTFSSPKKVYCTDCYNNVLDSYNRGVVISDLKIQSHNYGLCSDCRVPLTPDQASIKFCTQCNGKWQALKLQGIHGPFG